MRIFFGYISEKGEIPKDIIPNPYFGRPIKRMRISFNFSTFLSVLGNILIMNRSSSIMFTLDSVKAITEIPKILYYFFCARYINFLFNAESCTLDELKSFDRVLFYFVGFLK